MSFKLPCTLNLFYFNKFHIYFLHILFEIPKNSLELVFGPTKFWFNEIQCTPYLTDLKIKQTLKYIKVYYSHE